MGGVLRGGRFAVAGVAIVSTLALAGCPKKVYGTCPEPIATPGENPVEQPGRAYDGIAGGARVAFVGDSLTYFASTPTDLSPGGAIPEAFAGGFRVHVEAQLGQTIAEMSDELADVLADPNGPPAALVVNLGTNDVMREDPGWEQAFDAMVATIGDHPCTLLVTVNETTDATWGATSTTATGINTRIAEVDAARANVYSVEWNEDFTAEGGYTPDLPHHYFTMFVPPEQLSPAMAAQYPNGAWLGDGIHLSPEGSVEMARRIRDVLDRNGTADVIGTTATTTTTAPAVP